MKKGSQDDGSGRQVNPPGEGASAPVKVPIAFHQENHWQEIAVNGAEKRTRKRAHANVLRENRATNSFATAFNVAMVFLAGLVVTAMGIMISSKAWTVAGCGILFGAAGLYGFLLM